MSERINQSSERQRKQSSERQRKQWGREKDPLSEVVQDMDLFATQSPTQFPVLREPNSPLHFVGARSMAQKRRRGTLRCHFEGPSPGSAACVGTPQTLQPGGATTSPTTPGRSPGFSAPGSGSSAVSLPHTGVTQKNPKKTTFPWGNPVLPLPALTGRLGTDQSPFQAHSDLQ